MRKQKSTADLARAAGDKVTEEKCGARINALKAKYNDLTEKCGLTPMRERMRVTLVKPAPNDVNVTAGDTEQHLKKVERDKNDVVSFARGGKTVCAERLVNVYNEMFATHDANIKPLQQHTLDKNLTEVKKLFGVRSGDNPPTIVLSSPEEMRTALASYNAVDNVLRVDSRLGISGQIPILQQNGVLPDNELSTLVHEFFHWEDAKNYRKAYGDITGENYDRYIKFLQKKAKKELDKIGITSNNIGGLSKYARDGYANFAFDEAYTEYRTLKKLEGK